MALPAALQLKTYDDLAAIPEDGHRYELIQGEIVTAAAPLRRHQQVIMALYDALRAHMRKQPGGIVMIPVFDVKLSDVTVVEPDLFFVRPERNAIVTEQFCDGPPDLVAEVLSPSNRGYDLIRKAAIYLEHRVPEYWVLDPQNAALTVNIWRDGRNVPEPIEDRIARSTVIPGFSVPLAELFPWEDESITQSDDKE